LCWEGKGKGGNWDQKAGRFGRSGLKETNQTKDLIAGKSKQSGRAENGKRVGATDGSKS
jgi:hypothetical protein